MACLPSSGVIQGVTTDNGRTAMAQSILGPLLQPPYDPTYVKYFKIGTGGYILGPGGTKVPKTPSESQEDLDSESNPNEFTFQKDLTVSDLSFEFCDGIAYAVLRAFLDLSEANDDGTGAAPEFFEIGFFDPQDVLLFYTTIPGETKNASKTLNHFIYVNF